MMMNRREILKGAGVIGAASVLPNSSVSGATRADPVIAAASSLRFCLDRIAAEFKNASGLSVRLVFGSSGNLVRQIEQGAPFSLFLSADEAFVLRLVKGGYGIDDGALYAIGRVVLVARKDKDIVIDPELKGLAAALAAGKINRFAIANPDHAPYGLRAKEVLQHARLWPDIRDKLALGENVAQAAQFASSGAADAGLIAYAFTFAPGFSRLVNQAAILATWHRPIHQRMVRLVAATDRQGQTAHRFYRFMQSAAGRSILKNSGFDLPSGA